VITLSSTACNVSSTLKPMQTIPKAGRSVKEPCATASVQFAAVLSVLVRVSTRQGRDTADAGVVMESSGLAATS
jgi:hypothetical protein